MQGGVFLAVGMATMSSQLVGLFKRRTTVNRISLLVLLFGLIATSYAQAQYGGGGGGRTRSTALIDANGNSIQHGWAGYLGAGAGYSDSNSNSDVAGMPSSLKLLGSYVSRESTGVFDAGFGVQNQSFSQDGATDTSISTGVAELAARYQFENRWQLGGVLNQFLNKGINYRANQADAQFGGVQLLREFSFGGSYLGRVGGRIMTSLNVDNESVNMAIVDFQIGWGGSNRGQASAAY